jgi:hypothetical protein
MTLLFWKRLPHFSDCNFSSPLRSHSYTEVLLTTLYSFTVFEFRVEFYGLSYISFYFEQNPCRLSSYWLFREQKKIAQIGVQSFIPL